MALQPDRIPAALSTLQGRLPELAGWLVDQVDRHGAATQSTIRQTEPGRHPGPAAGGGLSG